MSAISIILAAAFLGLGSIGIHFRLKYRRELTEFRANLKTGELVRVKLLNGTTVPARIVRKDSNSIFMVCEIDTKNASHYNRQINLSAMTFITTDDLGRHIKKAVKEAIQEGKEAIPESTLHTFSQAARLLGKSYNTICNMVSADRIKATADGRYISQRAINNYLDGQK